MCTNIFYYHESIINWFSAFISEIDNKIAEALEDATGGESAAAVKAALDAYKTTNDTRVGNVETEVDAL